MSPRPSPPSPLPRRRRRIVAGLYRRRRAPVYPTARPPPQGPIDKKWTTRKFEAHLVNPANRRKLSVIIVGTGLAGGAAAPRSARPATR
jgi:succinate dehydrogenase / fumarate reductase flavoprotein subunit